MVPGFDFRTNQIYETKLWEQLKKRKAPRWFESLCRAGATHTTTARYPGAWLARAANARKPVALHRNSQSQRGPGKKEQAEQTSRASAAAAARCCAPPGGRVWFTDAIPPAPRPPKQKNIDFPLIIFFFFAKTTIFKVSRPSRVDWYQNFWISSLPDRFRYENVFFDCQLASGPLWEPQGPGPLRGPQGPKPLCEPQGPGPLWEPQAPGFIEQSILFS